MRLTWGVNKRGDLFVVDVDRNPHEAISGPLNPFQAIVFIDRIKRKFKKSQTRAGRYPARSEYEKQPK